MRSRNGWRAGYQEIGPSGSEGGSVKPDLATNRGARFLPYKVRSYLSHRAHWEKSGTKKGEPGLPGATDYPTLYQGTCSLQLESAEVKQRFVQLKVYDGKTWRWMNYPILGSRYFEQRQRDESWEQNSPTLVLPAHTAGL